MPRQAIRNEGKGAEQLLLQLVENSQDSDSSKRGDAIVTVDGVGSYVEIKYTTSNTINQVRAVKFIPLVIYSPQMPLHWAVLPSNEVVRLVFEKARGQHTELALECANMSLSGIPVTFRCSDEALSDAVHNAIREARKYSELKRKMDELLAELRGMETRYRAAVRDALRTGDAR